MNRTRADTVSDAAKIDIIPIPSDDVGAVFGRYITDVDKRRTMAYAAGIGAYERLYLDDARREGIVAPLGFIVATDWPVFVAPDYLKAIGRSAETAYNGLVHGYQLTDFHRAIRPGDQLEVVGRIVATRQTRAGALVACRVATSDAETAEPVATGWFGSLYRKTPLAGEATAVEVVPELRPQAGVASEPIIRDELSIPPTQAHIYTECAQIWNPIHTEREFALASGLPDIILHGTCVWAMALQALARRHRPGREHPFRRFGARFSSMIVPGQTLVVEAGAPYDGTVPFAVRAENGTLALSHGLAVLA
jgi:acyl dehydratase